MFAIITANMQLATTSLAVRVLIDTSNTMPTIMQARNARVSIKNRRRLLVQATGLNHTAGDI